MSNFILDGQNFLICKDLSISYLSRNSYKRVVIMVVVKVMTRMVVMQKVVIRMVNDCFKLFEGISFLTDGHW